MQQECLLICSRSNYRWNAVKFKVSTRHERFWNREEFFFSAAFTGTQVTIKKPKKYICLYTYLITMIKDIILRKLNKRDVYLSMNRLHKNPRSTLNLFWHRSLQDEILDTCHPLQIMAPNLHSSRNAHSFLEYYSKFKHIYVPLNVHTADLIDRRETKKKKRSFCLISSFEKWLSSTYLLCFSTAVHIINVEVRLKKLLIYMTQALV